jgi:hypothetical protein
VKDEDFIFLVCEGPSDARAAKGFAERIILEQCPWLEPIEYRPQWQGVANSDEYLMWKNVAEVRKSLSEGRRNDKFGRRHGKFDGEGAKPDAIAARNAIQIAVALGAFAIVFCRDQDNQPERKEGLEQARKEFLNKGKYLPITIGAANPCTEAWILAGFVPQNKHEQSKLERIEKAHPKLTQKPHTLTDREEQKRHVATLAPPLERESLCWSETPLEQLHTRGLDCGLSEYLQELERYLVPALSASSPRG